MYGCDLCKKRISRDGSIKHEKILNLSVFFEDDRNMEELDFCSWECCLKFIAKIQRTKYKCDYFIHLPAIHFNDKKVVSYYGKFLKAIREYQND